MESAISEYVGKNDDHFQAMMNLPFANRDCDPDYHSIPLNVKQFDETFDVAWINTYVVKGAMDYTGVELIPNKVMHNMLYKAISASRLWPNCIKKPKKLTDKKESEPIKDIPNGLVKITQKCGDYSEKCPTIWDVFIPIPFLCDFYHLRKHGFKTPMRVIFRNECCVHHKHDRSKQRGNINMSQLLSQQSRTIELYDINNSNAANLGQVRRVSKRSLYTHKSDLKKQQYKHELLSESLHLTQINAVYEGSSKLEYFSNIPLYLQGNLHDFVVGFATGGSAYSPRSFVVFFLYFFVFLQVCLQFAKTYFVSIKVSSEFDWFDKNVHKKTKKRRLNLEIMY